MRYLVVVGVGALTAVLGAQELPEPEYPRVVLTVARADAPTAPVFEVSEPSYVYNCGFDDDDVPIDPGYGEPGLVVTGGPSVNLQKINPHWVAFTDSAGTYARGPDDCQVVNPGAPPHSGPWLRHYMETWQSRLVDNGAYPAGVDFVLTVSVIDVEGRAPRLVGRSAPYQMTPEYLNGRLPARGPLAPAGVQVR